MDELKQSKSARSPASPPREADFPRAPRSRLSSEAAPRHAAPSVQPAETTPRAIRILHLEDSDLDADLALAHLQRDGLPVDVVRVDTAETYLAAVQSEQPFDVILSDYFIPGFDGMSALRLARTHCARTPFIFVSGVLGEENAIESLKLGATDYVLKQRIERLGPSIRRALAEAEDRSARKSVEAALRRSQDQLDFTLDAVCIGRWELNLDSGHFSSHSALYDKIVCGGPCPENWSLQLLLDSIHPDDRSVAETSLADLHQPDGQCDFECRLKRPESAWTWVWVKGARQPDNSHTHAAGLVMDINARKEAQHERERLLNSEREARAEAERASRLKDDFLATLSHELRTPLNAVLGWAQLLGRGSIPASEVPEAVSIIERNAKLQAQLVEDLLDMSRITGGKLRLDWQTVDLGTVARAAITAIRPTADGRNVSLVENITPGESLVRGDPVRLQQIIWNLLSNSVKFTPAGGRIELAVIADDATATVRVTDSGQGISSQFLPHVFARFRQQDGSTTRRYGGLGVGLSIVRHLVELHGGQASAYSDGPDRGAIFTITLPLYRADARDGDNQNTPDLLPPDLKDVVILVVDDEADTRDYIRRVLEDHDAKVLTAPSAAAGLTLLVERRPAVLLSDLGMPEQDGYEFIRRVRQLPPAEGGLTPAVAVTAYARVEDRQRALREGFQMHVTKPIEPSTLLKVVGRLLPPSKASRSG